MLGYIEPDHFAAPIIAPVCRSQRTGPTFAERERLAVDPHVHRLVIQMYDKLIRPLCRHPVVTARPLPHQHDRFLYRMLTVRHYQINN